MADPPPAPGSPRRVKVFGTIAVLFALLAAIVLVTSAPLPGIGNLHGPARHISPGAVRGNAPAASIPEATALTVTVAGVETRSMEASVLATGTVVAWEELPIAAEVAGLAITEVLVDEGDRVEKGQLLARLNDVHLQAEIEQQKASIAEAQANLEAARVELRRGQQLLGSNAISAQEAEQRATAAKTAEARLAVAEAGLVRLNAQLAQASIRAPASGYVSKKSAVLGQVVQTGVELFRVVRDGRLEVAAEVPETDLFGTAPGQSVRVTGPAGRTIEAEVRAVAPTVDPRTRLGIVHVALPPDSGLKPGMFARTEIVTGQSMALSVPQTALVWRNARSAVFVLRDGIASLQPVSTGIRQDGWIEIRDGLAPGDRVAIAGAGFLKNGDRVRVELAEAVRISGEAAR